MIIKNEAEFLNNIFKNKSKDLYNFINKKVKTSNMLPYIFKLPTKTLLIDKEISDAFNDYFYSVYNNSSTFEYSQSSDFSFKLITASEVKLSLCKFANNTSVGLDGLPVYFLKQLDDSFIQFLALLFNQFLKYNYYPASWKSAVITPLYKNGPIDDVKSYRPISVTNIFSRIFERIM